MASPATTKTWGPSKQDHLKALQRFTVVIGTEFAEAHKGIDSAISVVVSYNVGTHGGRHVLRAKEREVVVQFETCTTTRWVRYLRRGADRHRWRDDINKSGRNVINEARDNPGTRQSRNCPEQSDVAFDGSPGIGNRFRL